MSTPDDSLPPGHPTIADSAEMFEFPPTPTFPPHRVGRFEIRRFLGEGAFGRVYEAYDPLLRRVVALKVAKPEQIQGQKALERFHREARAAANLLHPNIVAVFDHSEDGGQHYIASAYVAGRPLDDVLRQRQAPLPLRDAATLTRRLAEALAYAHKAGIIHRDVKPANVMLSETSEPMLMDFGLAARLDEQEKLTQDGATLGTYPYMAPEQWRNRAEAGSDQYSLGCLFFEVLTGRTPFGGGTSDHWMYLHLNQAPPSLQSLRPEIPRDLENVCLKCLEKEPARRYADCQALADDLRRWLDGEPVTARRPGPLERVAKWARRSPSVAALLAAVFLILTAGVSVSSVLAVMAKREADRAEKAREVADEALREKGTALAREQEQRSQRALAQVEALLTARPAAVPPVLKSLADQPDDALPRVRQVWKEAAVPGRKMRAALALLPTDPDLVKADLVDWMLQVPDPAELLVIRDSLLPYASELRGDLWQRLAQTGATQGQKLRLLAALAAFDPTGSGWKQAGDQALEAWLGDNPLYLGVWTEALRPVRDVLLGPLTQVFQGRRLPERRTVVASILADYLSDRPEALAERLAEADQAQFPPLFHPLRKQHADRAKALLMKEVKRSAPEQATEAEREALARSQANAGLGLMSLGLTEPVWPLLMHSPYPEARSRLVMLMGQLGVEARTLIERLEVEKDVSARRALIVALGEYSENQLPAQLRTQVTRKLLTWYRDDPDPGIHGAIDWLLRHDKEGPKPRLLDWGQRKELERIDTELAAKAWAERVGITANQVGLALGGGPFAAASLAWPPGLLPEKGWVVNSQRQTFTVLDGREPFLMGSPEGEAGHEPDQTQRWEKIGWRFAIQTKAVTVAEWERFQKANPMMKPLELKSSAEKGCPIGGVSWYHAAAYCRWLSEVEGVPEQEMVYPPIEIILKCAEGKTSLPENPSRTGYRLPSEAEWEFSGRAGASTCGYYGSSMDLMPRYGWVIANSQERTWPVGQKRPNDLGLFDQHGNVWNWCQEYLENLPVEIKRSQERHAPVLRGGSYSARSWLLRLSYRGIYEKWSTSNTNGFRLCRTYY